MVWAYLTGKHAQKLVRKWTQHGGAAVKTLTLGGYNYTTIVVRWVRRLHTPLFGALELNLSLPVDSERARLCGSAGFGSALRLSSAALPQV